MPAIPAPDAPITVPVFRADKGRGDKLTVLTCYDYTFARLLDAAGIEALLVGDSLGMVIQGQPTSLKVTMRQMMDHTSYVARGAKRALVIADMPFLSYQTSPRDAVRNAGKLIQAGASAVKLEGGARMADAIAACVKSDIPVMAHIGLTPQSVHATGGFKVQREEERLLADAKAIEAAGAFAVVIESVPEALAAKVTSSISIPTIGIGAGAACDGQVLVLHDMLGLFPDFKPKFVKQFAPLGEAVTTAVRQYWKEVKLGQFPSADHTFK
jgi:3-methyl-2-oxobutanoate hydroxymethyltransferase